MIFFFLIYICICRTIRWIRLGRGILDELTNKDEEIENTRWRNCVIAVNKANWVSTRG